MIACPARETLAQFLADETAGPEAVALIAHVDACPRCQALLDQLSGSLPTPAFSSHDSEGPRDGFLHRLKLLAPAGGAGPLLGVTFPHPPTERGPLGRLLHYHLIEPLGWGAKGVVFKAHDDKLDRAVAIKVLRPEHAGGEGRARFLREARTAASVQHEHVVAVYQADAVSEFPLPFLVMEFVEGETLRERLRRLGPLPPREAARIVAEAAEGLARAHVQGVVHRDVNPSNILLESATARVKLTDFGLAGDVRSGGLAGTPTYMSPEQAAGRAGIDARSDVYSLGVVLYELLLGEPPFRGPSARVLQQVLHGQPLPPRLANPTLPAELERLVLSCLARQPGRRPAAADLARQLRSWLDGRPRHGPWQTTLSQAGRWCRGHAGGLLFGVLALVGLIGLAAWATHLDRRTTEQQTRLAEQEREANRLRAEQALERGVALCESRQVGEGLCWLTHGLDLAPVECEELQAALRLQLGAWSRQQPSLAAVHPQEGAIYGVAFSADGRHFLAGGHGQVARLWRVDSGQPVAALEHDGPIVAVALPAGDRHLLARAQGVIHAWDLQTPSDSGRPYRLRRETATGYEFHSRYQANEAVGVCSRDGTLHLTVSKDGVARLWDARTAEGRGGPWSISWPVSCLDLSPDGRTLATVGKDSVARLWDVTTGQPIGVPCVHRDEVTSVRFSPDGRLLLTTSKDHTARLWDSTTGRPHGTPLWHVDKVYQGDFSLDGQLILTGSKDHTARLWETVTGRPLGGPGLHPGPVFSVAFRNDGLAFLSGCADGAVRLWEVNRDRPQVHRQSWQRPAEAIAIAPDGEAVYLASDSTEGGLWPLTEGRAPAWGGHATAAVFSRPGHLLATGRFKLATVRDATTGQPRDRVLPHDDTIRCLAFSADESLLLTGSEDRLARVWDANTGELRGQTPPHGAAVIAVAFHPGGQLFATGCWDGTAQLWDVSTCRTRALLRHRGAVMAVLFSADGQFLLTASRDGTAQCWDTETGAPLGRPMRHLRPLSAAALAEDGRLAALASEDGALRFWEVPAGRPLGPPFAHPGPVQALALRPQGRGLVVAGQPGRVEVWPVPALLIGDAGSLRRQIERATGLEWADGRPRSLDAASWKIR